MDELVFSKLRFSFYSLCNENTKSCFLYCCIFLEDFDIPIEKLMWLWIGDGLLNDSKNLDEAFDEGNKIIADLQRICLLESSFKGLVKMHDVIRDMTLWIDRTEKKYIFMVEGMAINDRLMVEWEKANWISLWDVNSIDSNCSRTYSNLSTLLLPHHMLLLHPSTFPRGFFHCMPFIKVSDFQNSGLMSVPKEICNLVSL